MINHPDTDPICIRVTTAAHFQKGNVVFFGVAVDASTLTKTSTDTYYVVSIKDQYGMEYCEELAKGAVVEVVPTTALTNKVTHDSYDYKQIKLTTDGFALIRPSGGVIVELLSSSRKFKGIGPRKAQKLWDTFSESLYEILDSGDVDRLEEILTPEVSADLIESWQSYVVTEALLYCNRILELQTSVAFRVIRYFKEETKKRIEEDPYRLLSFSVSFEKCDAIARGMKIGLDDERRLSAAVESALYATLDDGDTIATHTFVWNSVNEILQDKELATQALKSDYENEKFTILANGYYQVNGVALMEQYVAKRLAGMLSRPNQLDLLGEIDNTIAQYEDDNGFPLTDLQKEAVTGAVLNPLFLINGGAGVGKTTVLGSVYKCFDSFGIIPIQVALAAKAAMRMTEATGREASTIARFIRSFNFDDVDASKVTLVIDESSMVDLPSMYKLLCVLPQKVRIIFVGDIGQLPPIGFGLILHELIKVDEIPSVTLKEVKRQGKNSNIPNVSKHVREGVVPEFNDSDVQFIHQPNSRIMMDTILAAYRQDSKLQIICPTRRLVKQLNGMCAGENNGQRLLVFNDYFESKEDTGFRCGDQVMCITNLYEHNVMNGSLGIITACYDDAVSIEIDEGIKPKMVLSYGKVKWDDGVERDITEDIIDNLEHSYAMTIHKSQGSQFDTVVIPIVSSLNFDRSMLYTALTRAQSKVIFVGDQELLPKIISWVSVEGRQADLAVKIQKAIDGRE